MKQPDTPALTEHALVYVIDDDRSVREALHDLLSSVDLPARTFASPAAFLGEVLPDRPSCIVSDIRMPIMGGLEFQRQLRDAGQSIPVIFITAHGDIPMSVQAMKDGAIDFLTKPFREQDLLDAIQRAIALDTEQRRARKQRESLRVRFDTLNEGEREVFRRVVAGLLNKQIAAELGISEVTVKVRRGQVMRKMAADSLADLVRMAEYIALP